MRNARLTLFSVFIVFVTIRSSVLQAGNGQIYFEADSVSFLESPIYDVWDDELGRPAVPFTPGEIAFTYNRFELGTRTGRFQVGVLWRYDYLFTFTPDAARFVYIDENDQSFVVGDKFNIFIDAFNIRMHGVKFGYHWPVRDDLNISLTLSALKADTLIDGDLHGLAAVEAEDDGDKLTGDVFLDYTYTEDKFLENPVRGDVGEGISSDISVAWVVSSQWNIHLELMDWFSHMRWKDLPFSEVRVNPRNPYIDENGQLHTQATASGFEGVHDYTHRIPRRSRLNIAYKPFQQFHVTGQLFNTANHWLPRFGGRWVWQQDYFLELGYGLETEATHVGFQTKYLQFELMTNEWNFEFIQSASLLMKLNIPVW